MKRTKEQVDSLADALYYLKKAMILIDPSLDGLHGSYDDNNKDDDPDAVCNMKWTWDDGRRIRIDTSGATTNFEVFCDVFNVFKELEEGKES